jgi:small GTP-binding protein
MASTARALNLRVHKIHQRLVLGMEYNVSFVGEAAVGKTTIAQCLARNEFTASYKSTIGASMVKILHERPGQEAKMLCIWDTAGTEKYRSLTPVYFRGSVAAVIVYDISDPDTFARVDDWIVLYNGSCGEGNPILIIGNKLDLPRAVEHSDGARFAEAKGCQFLEVSAKDGQTWRPSSRQSARCSTAQRRASRSTCTRGMQGRLNVVLK